MVALRLCFCRLEFGLRLLEGLACVCSSSEDPRSLSSDSELSPEADLSAGVDLPSSLCIYSEGDDRALIRQV